VPERATVINGAGGRVGVKGDEEGRGVYCMQDRCIMWVFGQVGVVLTFVRGCHEESA
jgi:hypothetical protein